ncbi:MAG: hypothetical protein OEQ13_01455 [Acidobacteriota bacterium]|nr:hypothetical protein [Acidobacteriota bacterium]
MAGLSSAVSFLAILAVALGVLRLGHIGAGVIRPDVVTGSVAVANLIRVERSAGFVPLVPYYRPIGTGIERPEITVTRRELVTVEIVWRSANELRLLEWRGEPMLSPPPGAAPIATFKESALWSSDGRVEALVRVDGTWVHLTTDLPERDVRRIVATLRPP